MCAPTNQRRAQYGENLYIELEMTWMFAMSCKPLLAVGGVAGRVVIIDWRRSFLTSPSAFEVFVKIVKFRCISGRILERANTGTMQMPTTCHA